MERFLEVRHPYQDTAQQQQARGLLKMAWGTIVLTTIGFFVLLLFRSRRPLFEMLGYPVGWTQIIYFIIFILSLISFPIVIRIVNAGKLEAASGFFVFILYVIALLAYISSKPTGFLMIAFGLPITAAGVMLKRKNLIAITVLVVITLTVMLLLNMMNAIDYLWTAEPTLGEAVAFSAIILMIESVILSTFIGKQRVLLQQNQHIMQDLQQALKSAEQATESLRQAEAERAQLQQQIIDAQKQALLELASPTIPVTEDVLVLPLLGTIDTDRARQIMRTLLNDIAESRTKFVIMDVTGVSTIDTAIANHLVQVTKAAQLMGAQCIMTGIRPEVARTILSLGVSFEVPTRSDLQAGIEYALTRLGSQLGKIR